MSTLDRAIAEAHEAVNEAIGASYTRRQFTVSKFGRHRDGYLHARVVVNGQPFYFSRRYGSWLAPGTMRGQEIDREPEALLGTRLGREVKFALADKARQFFRAEERTEDDDAA